MCAVPAVLRPEAAIRKEVPRVSSSLNGGYLLVCVWPHKWWKLCFLPGQLAIDELAGLFWIEESASRERVRTVSPNHPVVMVTELGGWGNMAAAKASACSVCV